MTKPMFDESEGSGNFYNLPKVGGEPVVVTFTAIRRINEEGHERNFQSLSPKKNWGFRYIITFDGDKEYTLNTWKLFYALKNAKVYEGDTIKISHPERGVWEVELMKNTNTQTGELVKKTSEDMEYFDKIGKKNSQVSDEVKEISDKFDGEVVDSGKKVEEW